MGLQGLGSFQGQWELQPVREQERGMSKFKGF